MRNSTNTTLFLGMLATAILCCGSAVAQPLGNFKYPKPIRLTFHGEIDGSELIEISATHARWTRKSSGWPTKPVYLNDVAWNPREDRSIDNSGKTRYLHQPVVFKSARLENVKGRDAVALDARNDLVRVQISDTPKGVATYEFDIVFDPPAVAQALRIRADIDGSDRLIIDKTGARWEHRHWKWPNKVFVGQIGWNPRKDPKLPHAESTLR